MSLDFVLVLIVNGIFTFIWIQTFRYTNNRLFALAAIWQAGAILVGLLSKMALLGDLSWSVIFNIYALVGGVPIVCIGVFQHFWPYPLLSTSRILHEAEESAKRGDLRSAIYAARQARVKAPRDPYTHFLLGKLFDEMGQPSKALNHLKFACQLSPSSVEALSELGKAATAVRAYQDAIRAYQAILTLQPDNELASRKLKECQIAAREG